MAKKYTGANAHKLGYLPDAYRKLYERGHLSDETVDEKLEEILASKRPASPEDAAVGPPTLQEQGLAEGFVSAGGSQAGTGRATAAALASDQRSRTYGIAQMLSEGALATPEVAIDFMSQANPLSAIAATAGQAASVISRGINGKDANPVSLKNPLNTKLTDYLNESFPEQLAAARELAAVVPNAVLPDYVTTEEGQEEARAFREGRALSTAIAEEQAGPLGKLAIKLAPQASQAATSVAALMASRSPLVAKVVGSLGMADIGTSVLGNTYLEGRDKYEPGKAAGRAVERLGVELATELVNPLKDTASVIKALGHTAFVGAGQEALASEGGMLLDAAKYGEFGPKTSGEIGKEILTSAALGFGVTGTIAAPAAYSSAKYTAAMRDLESDVQFAGIGDPDFDEGYQEGKDILEDLRRGKTKVGPLSDYADKPTNIYDPIEIKEQGDLLAERGDGRQEGPAAPGTGYVPSPNLGEGRDPTRVLAEPVTGPPLGTQRPLFTNKQAPKVIPPASPMEQAQRRIEDEAKKKAEAAKKQQESKLKALKPGIEADVLAKNPNLKPQEFDAIMQIRMRKERMHLEQEALAKKDAVATKATTKAEKAAAKAAPAEPAPKAASAVLEEATAEMAKQNVWSQKGKEEPVVGLTKEQLKKRFINDESADGYKFREALRSGKVKIVNNIAEVVDHQMASSAKGVHINEDGQIYLAVDNLNEKDLIGTMLHEVTHHAIRKHRDGNAPSGMKGLFGEENVTRMIRDIRRLADYSNNKVAKAAVARYDAAKKADPNTIEEEVLTYFIEEGSIARANKGILGSAGTILSDAVKSAKIAMKEATGINATVSVDDLQVYARRMVDDLSKAKKAEKFSDPNYKPPKDPAQQFSFLGVKSGLMDDDRLVSEFVGKDGMRRREVDTSKFTMPKDSLDKLVASGKSTLGDLLQGADILTKEAYGGALGKLPVRYDPKLSMHGGVWNGKEVVIGPVYGNTEIATNVLLHEVQHAIQQKEGFARGTNSAQETTQADRNAADFSNRRTKLKLDTIAKTPQSIAKLVAAATPIENKEGSIKGLRSLRDMTSGKAPFDAALARDQAANVLDAISASVISKGDKPLPAYMDGVSLDKDISSYVLNKNEASKVEKEGRDAYLGAQGEIEARSVESRRKLSKGEREEQKDPIAYRAHIDNIKPDKITNKYQQAPDDVAFSIDPTVTYPRARAFGTGRGVAPRVVPIPGTKGRIAVPRESAIGRGHNALNALFKNKVPRAFDEIKARESGEVNGYALDALNNLNTINHAINQYPNPEQAVKALQDYETSKTREERLQKAAKLKVTMPAVFGAYNQARASIFRMSKEIIYLMDATNYRATAKEKAVIMSISKNIGNYLTTTYKAIGPSKVRAAHISYLYSTERGQEIRDNAEQWARDNIFTFNELDKKSEDWLRSAYEAIVPLEYQPQERSADSLSRKELLEVLHEVETVVSDEMLDKVSKQFVEDLLRVGKGASSIGRAAKMFKGSGQDMTIITPKTDVPQAIRDLWGEQSNPVMNVFATMVKQGEFIAKAKSQYRMLNELSGTYIFDNWGALPSGAQAVQVKSDGMGPLAGKWTTPEIKDFLEAKQEADKSLAEIINSARYGKDLTGAFGDTMRLAGNAVGRLGSTFKWMSVVWKPINWAYNYGGSMAQLLMNGNYGKYVAKGHKMAFKEAPNAPFKTYSSDEMQELVRNSVFDSSLAGEIQERERQSIIQGLVEQGSNVTIKHSKLAKFSSGVTDLYAGADIWAKVANYFHEKDHVAAYHKAMGNSVTAEQIEREAAERIRQTNFSYDQAWAPAKWFEKNGITNFLTYNMEVFRTAIGNIRFGLQDVASGMALAESNPKAAALKKAHGIRRLAGVGAAIGFHTVIFSTMANMLAGLVDAPEEDEKERAIMQGVSDMFSGGLLKLVGITGGKREYFDAGRLDPYGPLNEIMRAVAEGDLTKMKEAVAGLWITNEILAEAVDASVAAVKDGEQKAKPPRLKGTAPDIYAAAKDLAVSMGMTPSIADRSLRAVESMTPSILGTVAAQMFTTEEQDIPHRMFAAAGGRLVTYDPNEDLRSHAAYEFKGPLDDIRNSWGTWSKAVISPSAEDIQEKYEQAANDEFDLWSKALPKVAAARLAGLPTRLVQAELKDAGLNQEQIASLLNGKFYPSIISVKKLDSDEQMEIKLAGDNAAAIKKIKEKYKVMRPTIARLSRNYVPYEE